jgi:hypothetical protein
MRAAEQMRSRYAFSAAVEGLEKTMQGFKSMAAMPAMLPAGDA